MKLPSLVADAYLIEMEGIAAIMPAGDFVEVGVYCGGSAQYLDRVARRQGRRLHLFDTFTGIPFQGPMDRHVVGEFDGRNYETMIRNEMPEALVYKGIFPDTLANADYAAFAETLRTNRIAFIHADGDQYQTTYDILCSLVGPLVVSGGAVIFDDYHGPMCRGCTAAVDWYVGAKQTEVEFKWTPLHRAMVVKR